MHLSQEETTNARCRQGDLLRPAVMAARLRLLELAEKHSLAELLRATLDEAEALTTSRIGFYHFLEEDQITLSLQAWSTNTAEKMCRVEGAQRHYPVDQAGVWVDCIRERQPVVHNDYASLSHRKGLPPGHAEVVRELVVPVMRAGRIMAILGVGNKPSDYVAEDLEAVGSLADLAWDIAERKRAQEALAESEARFRQLVENSPAPIMVHQDGRFVLVNDAAAALFGARRREDLLGSPVLDRVHPDFRERIINRMQSMALTGEPAPALEEKLLRLDGQTIEAEVAGTTFLLHGRRAVQVVLRDITDRKRAEEVLARSRSELKAIYDHAPVMMCVVDAQRRVLYANPAFTAFTGVSDKDMAGGRACGIFGCINALDNPAGCGFGTNCARCGLRLAMEDTIRTGTVHRSIEYHTTLVRGNDSRAVSLLGSTARIHADDENHLLLCLLDITERRRSEEEREKLQAQLNQAQKMESVGRLAGGVAHDFNNMLQAILGHTALLLEDLPKDSPLRESLEEVQQCAQRSADLTRQLLAFARKQTATPRLLDLNGTVEGMLKMLRRIIGEDINLAWLPGAGLWPVKVDPSQIDQVLANLCVNARDAIHGVGKVILETRNLTLQEQQAAAQPDSAPGDYVLLAVSDTGCGMDQATLGHLFEPFFTTKGPGRGTGLGLATVYGIVKQNQGFIQVESAPDRGTTFLIHLPRHQGLPAPEPAASAATPTAAGGHETILLVEDEAAILKIGKRALETLGYQVLAAASPGEALQLVQSYPGEIHLLMTDVVMPEMNGNELARQVKLLKPKLKHLFMSGYTADVIARHGVVEDGLPFIQKPFKVAVLARKVREVLQSQVDHPL